MERDARIDWLLDGPAWLAYAVRTQLLDEDSDVQDVLDDEDIQYLIERLIHGNRGFSALGSGRTAYDETGNVYWDLYFLADIGLTADDLHINDELERIFRLQNGDGSFSTDRRVRNNYFCMSAILISSLAKMGYSSDSRIEKYIMAIWRDQLHNGGWHCFGEWGMESCPMEDLNVLMLLGQYEKYRRNERLNGAINLLLEHWNRRERGWNLTGFGCGRRFCSLKYPVYNYGILRVLNALSLFPYAVRSSGFQDMLNYVHERAVDGLYYAEAIDGNYSRFDFGQTKEPSRWITFLLERIDKRVAEIGEK